MNSKKNLIFVVGPTASGKTSLSVELALKLDAQIVSADSMQIYKGISIASAAPTEEEKKGVKHHLFEFLETDETFTVAEYSLLARRKIDEILNSSKNCIVVGGTGLYINTLTDNIEFTLQEDNTKVRAELEEMMESYGAEYMLEKLKKIDSEAAEKLHPNNKRRILRAIEVYELTGKTFTELNLLSRQNDSPYNPIMIGITYRDREKLYERINKRVDLMIENGILDEAKKYFSLNHSKGAAQAIGHKELEPYLSGKCDIVTATENLKRATRRYAKRQMTWFRRDERIHWIYADETDNVLEKAIKIIETEMK